MGESIIEVKNLSKSFIISHEGRERYTALRDVVAQKAKKIFSFPASLRGTKQFHSKEEFWALKDVSFNIEQGDRVGIIGRNGAGKSTLLKILSRITEPTQGEIRIRGRVASLLEVGTGFHPELTGRENIFLNGAILGMSRAEIKRKFDEIVDFAEVEKFLDTPVKRYSSGMYVRLAFAVAAYLEPEILIVDEVLAVGDVQFQKKCLGKMEDVSKNQGRTVVFVSHNMSVMTNLCNVGVLLSAGIVETKGNINDVVTKYLNTNTEKGKNFIERNLGLKWWLNDITIIQDSFETKFIDAFKSINLILDFEGAEARKISFEFLIKDSNHLPVIFIPLGLAQNINFDCKPGKYRVSVDVEMPQLALGEYFIDIFIVESFIQRISSFQNAYSFEVISSYIQETGWNFEKYNELGSLLTRVNHASLEDVA